MRLTKQQRERFYQVAEERLQRLETRLQHPYKHKRRMQRDAMHYSEALDAYRQRLRYTLRDDELVTLNADIAELSYRASNTFAPSKN